MTDADKAIDNAVSTVFSNVPHLLCYWHIQENARKHHEGTFNTEEEAGDAALTGVGLDTWDNFVEALPIYACEHSQRKNSTKDGPK